MPLPRSLIKTYQRTWAATAARLERIVTELASTFYLDFELSRAVSVGLFALVAEPLVE